MRTLFIRKHGSFIGLGVVFTAALFGLFLFEPHEPNQGMPDRLSPAELQGDDVDDGPEECVDAAAALTVENESRAHGFPDAASAGDGALHDVQSPARPFGLDIVSPVRMAGSDEASAAFMEFTLPDVLEYIESNVVHSSDVEQKSFEAGPYNLTLDDPASVRVYFVGEEAGYHNSIGVNYADDSGSMLIFPDASTMVSYFPDADARQEYTSAENPLMPGDFIDIGAVEDGSLLDFFIIPRGAHEASEAYGIDKTINADQASHVRILGVVDGSVIVLGFEDQTGGGDRDYDDVIIAVEIGENNLNTISDSLGL